jgi:small subunit ribosomal protein S11
VILFLGLQQEVQGSELEKYSFAAQTAAEKAALEALSTGMKNVEILVKGQGSGRETAIRAIEGAGFDIISIQDITSVPHNGCRPPKRRRV